MKKFSNILKISVIPFLKKISPVYYLVILAIIGIGTFNAITGVMPQIQQSRYEKGIVKSFDKWWAEEGAEKFKSVGLEPTEKIRNEEFEQFRDRALALKPSYIVEDRIETMKQEFRQWWEIQGGKEDFIRENNRYPGEADYQRELSKWIDNYTEKFVRYNMAFIPQKGHYERLLTSWMLFPSVWSFAIFAVFFIFTLAQLERRWHWYIFWGITAALAICSGILVDILTGTSFFDHYSSERYMGMSLTLAFLLGASSFAPRKELVSRATPAICFIGLVLDMGANWFANPGIFGAVTVLSPLMFAGGAFSGIKIETRRKSKRELKLEALEERARRIANRNPLAEMKAKTRAMIESGISSAKGGSPEQAARLLTQAMVQLLQEHPIDADLVVSLADRMSMHYVEISSNQWLEWGEIAKAKNAPKAAVKLLKKGLSLEKDRNFARRALFILGETCIRNKIELEDGKKRLQKVIEMNGNDILAKQAQKILESIPAPQDQS